MSEAIREPAWKVVQILVWLLVGSAWFFGDNNAMKERVAVLESRIEQETRGLTGMQTASTQRMERLEQILGDRLDKLDRKLDCLVNRALCH